MPCADPTNRFSDRVEDYVRYRPGYPPAVLDTLRAETDLTPTSIIADIGSGTGLSAHPFLAHGNTVYGVEPNAEMRAAAERLLADQPRLHSIAGTAEATTLPAGSVSHVVAGQAFHWFDPPRARTEFARILCHGGWVVLVWNTRRTDSTPFLRACEQLLLTHGTDYREVCHSNIDAAVLDPFFGGPYAKRVLPNEQRFDRDGLLGRLRSSSYVPPPGHPNHAPLFAAAEALFRDHERGGQVVFEYDCELYFGRLG